MRRLSPDVLKAAVTAAAYYPSQLPAMPPARRRGWVDGGLCPFHDDRKTGNFRVNIDTGAFCCFSCGERGGDIIAFHRKLYGMDFPGALEDLANSYLPGGDKDA
jgi:hypothetical protein